jgi:hypothetical protein
MDDTKGAIAANLVDPELFEPPYHEIVAKAVDFHKKYKKAPGDAHIDDLFDQILSDPKNKKKRLYEQVLGNVIEQAKGLNADFVLTRIDEFMRRQNLLATVLKVGETLLASGGEDVLSQAEGELHGALRFKPGSTDKGVYLSDRVGLDYLFERSNCDVQLGIEPLDRAGIGLTYGEAMGLLAPKGAGKTQACVHVGVQCILQNVRALHVSLEMGNQRILPRYLRRLFSIAKTRSKYKQTEFELDKLGRVAGFIKENFKPTMALTDPAIEKKVESKMTALGTRLDRVHVKVFPTGQLTLNQLVAYMDNLESTDGFMPRVLILDYPELMRLDGRMDYRLAYGKLVRDLRGLLGERKMAGFFPFQSNRSGEDVTLLTSKHLGEDYSIARTVDDLLTYNQTKAEAALGLARLYVEKARNERDDFTVLITQDYETGRFVKQAAYMPSDYFRMIKGDRDDED